jgi:hypothetical protein
VVVVLGDGRVHEHLETSLAGTNESSGLSGSMGSTKSTHNVCKHRRFSSSGQSKRRHSDAREATSRPTYDSLFVVSLVMG